MTNRQALERRLRIAGWSAAAALLLLPAAAMQVTDAVRWTLFDFALAGTLFALVGGALELTVRLSRDAAYRAGTALALAAAFLLVWISGAVGIVGAEDDPANRLYVGVLAVALGGAALARLRPAGMARAMLAAAVLQAAIGVGAAVARRGVADPGWPLDLLGATAVFIALWLVSAWAFRRAARRAAAD